jgi:hypothetical protein
MNTLIMVFKIAGFILLGMVAVFAVIFCGYFLWALGEFLFPDSWLMMLPFFIVFLFTLSFIIVKIKTNGGFF